MSNEIKCGMRANCKTIDDKCRIDLRKVDLRKVLEEFYNKQAEITKRLEDRENDEKQ